MNAKLEIHRKFSLLASARRARILMDGREVAAIANGKTVTIDVPAGRHTITTKLGISTERPSNIDLESGQSTRLVCKIRMGLSNSGFALYREDGSKLAGDAGPSGHHGPMILIFGLLGFAVGLIGLAAVIQGIIDLNKMSKGGMDASGWALTVIGAILGGIGFLLNISLLVAMWAFHISPF
jgi:hypothetical protein